MSRATPRILETVTRVAPLAVRFADASTGMPVGDGLVVTAYAAAQPQRRMPAATANVAGTYFWHELPGLRAETFGAGDDGYWAGVSRREFVVEVRDARGRYLPATFTAPAPSRGLWAAESGWWPEGVGTGFGSPPGAAGLASPPGTDGGDGREVPLYSATERQAPAGAASLRVELRDGRTAPDGRERPAAWAVVTVDVFDSPWSGGPGRRGRGVADARGQVLVSFPYPAPPPASPHSPPDSPPGSETFPRTVSELQWRAALSVLYEPWWDPWWDPRAVPAAPPLKKLFSQRQASLAEPASLGGGAVDVVLFRYGWEDVFVGPDPVRDKRAVLYVTPPA